MLLCCGTSGGAKIQKLVDIYIYFGNNVVMVIILKMRTEYPVAHSLSLN